LATVVATASTLATAGTNITSALPPSEKPFDPKPLMDQLSQRISIDKFRFAVLGDSKHSPLLPELLKFMDEKVKPDFVLYTGDIVENGAEEEGVEQYRALAKEIGTELRQRPWWVVIGNHELGRAPQSGTDHFAEFFNLNSSRYSFTFRNAVFVALPYPTLTPQEEAWLRDELRSASAVHKLIFVFNHVPFYTVGAKSARSVPNRPSVVTKLFEQHGVMAVFSGHDHVYYDTVREGIPYIISAGAGAQTYELMRRAEAVPGDVYYGIDPKTRQGVLHRADGREETFSEQQVFLNVVDVDGDSVTCTCYNAAGEKWDERQLK